MFGLRRAYSAVFAIAAFLLWNEAVFAESCPDLPGQEGRPGVVSAVDACLPHASPVADITDGSGAFAKDLSPTAIYGMAESEGCPADKRCGGDTGGKVPLPTSVLLFGTGLASLGLLARRRRRPAIASSAYDK